MGPSVDSRKQARWLELVRRWQRSKLSVRAFCRRRQVSENNFYAWRRVRRERGLIEQTPAVVAAPALFSSAWRQKWRTLSRSSWASACCVCDLGSMPTCFSK